VVDTRHDARIELRRQVADDIVRAAEESVSALRERAAGAAVLEARAAEIEGRIQALARREHELAAREERAAVDRDAIDADLTRSREAAAEVEAKREALDRSWRELDRLIAENTASAAALEREREDLEDRARVLAQREARFASRWRWLLRAWSWRPPLADSKVRTCELLLVPSSDGYKLLEQEGVALRGGSRLTGLLAEEGAFLVSKIARVPFDGRWCAYLEQEPLHTKKGLS
jgi:hypothetical protein